MNEIKRNEMNREKNKQKNNQIKIRNKQKTHVVIG